MIKHRFVGRKDVLARLGKLFDKKSASLATVTGRRRIGKSRLIEEFAKDKPFFHFSGIPPTPETTAQSQRDVFAKQLGDKIGLSGIQASDWSDLFKLLAHYTNQGRVIILFDEISWMGSHDPDFLGKLKNAWDLELKKMQSYFLSCVVLSQHGSIKIFSAIQLFLEEFPFTLPLKSYL